MFFPLSLANLLIISDVGRASTTVALFSSLAVCQGRRCMEELHRVISGAEQSLGAWMDVTLLRGSDRVRF